jgi:hypothetical protein
MRNSHRLSEIKLSTNDVLLAIRDWYRFSEALDPEAEPDVDLSFETTVHEWRCACDLVSADRLGAWLNQVFAITASLAEWQVVLEPDCTLWDVCEFVSRQGAKRPSCAPLKLAGTECEYAGVFLALRSGLIQAGVPLAGASPSTQLAAITEHHFSQLITTVSILAPGSLPIPISRFEEIFRPSLRFTAAMSGIVLLLVFLVRSDLVIPAASSIMAMLFIYWSLCQRYILWRFGAAFYFHRLNTLADLVRVMAPNVSRQT